MTGALAGSAAEKGTQARLGWPHSFWNCYLFQSQPILAASLFLATGIATRHFWENRWPIGLAGAVAAVFIKGRRPLAAGLLSFYLAGWCACNLEIQHYLD